VGISSFKISFNISPGTSTNTAPGLPAKLNLTAFSIKYPIDLIDFI